MVVVEAADHVHVDAALKCFAGSGCAVIGDAVIHEFADGGQVTIDDAAETPLFAKNLLKRERVRGSGNSVQRIESAHDRSGTGIEGGTKRRKINFAEAMFGHVGGVVVAASLGGAVTHVVLGAGKNAFRIGEMAALIATDVGSGERRAEERIFAISFGGAAPAGFAGNVDHGRKSPADTGGGGFASRDAGGTFRKLRIPRGRNAERNRKLGAESVNDIKTKNDGNMEARFFNGDVLKRVRFPGGDDIEERADLTLGEHVVVVSAACTGAGGLACRILNELANFFLERHFLEEFFDASFDGGIIQIGRGLRSGSGSRRRRLGAKRARRNGGAERSKNREQSKRAKAGKSEVTRM